MEKVEFKYRVEECIVAPFCYPSRQAFIEFMDCYKIYPVEDRHTKEDESYLKSKKEWKVTDSYPSVWKFHFHLQENEAFNFTLLIEGENDLCNISCFFVSSNETSMNMFKEVVEGLKKVVFIVKECFSDTQLFVHLGEEELMNCWNKTDRVLHNEKGKQVLSNSVV